MSSNDDRYGHATHHGHDNHHTWQDDRGANRQSWDEDEYGDYVPGSGHNSWKSGGDWFHTNWDQGYDQPEEDSGGGSGGMWGGG